MLMTHLVVRIDFRLFLLFAIMIYHWNHRCLPLTSCLLCLNFLLFQKLTLVVATMLACHQRLVAYTEV